MQEEMEALSRDTQQRVCEALERIDGARCRETVWERPDDGGTIYVDRILEDGDVIEKMSVNFAIVRGELSEPMQRAALGTERELIADKPRFYATGVSIVIHPRSPLVPSAHANYRYFELAPGQEPAAWWFGGGADLTPSYLFDEDARHFHRVHREACDAHDRSFYPRFKRQCDEYFYIPHRGEHRGIGGIFFDQLHDREPRALLAFIRSCADAFLVAYLPIVQRRNDAAVSGDQRRWQQTRRGRYAEFNLTADRGIAFGLKSNGRTESILMALPPSARWEYNAEPGAGTEEARLADVLRHPRDWA